MAHDKTNNKKDLKKYIMFKIPYFHLWEKKKKSGGCYSSGPEFINP